MTSELDQYFIIECVRTEGWPSSFVLKESTFPPEGRYSKVYSLNRSTGNTAAWWSVKGCHEELNCSYVSLFSARNGYMDIFYVFFLTA